VAEIFDTFEVTLRKSFWFIVFLQK